MTNPVLDAISARRSIRGYEPQQLTKEQLDTIMKAAEEAPSARNLQPWHFSVVQNAGILAEINAETDKILKRESGDIFYAAPTVIFISCEAEARFSRIDCGIATQTIALAAHSIGLGTVILGMPDMALNGERSDYFKAALKIPEGSSFAIAIAVGVPTMTKEAHPIEPGRIDIIA